MCMIIILEFKSAKKISVKKFIKMQITKIFEMFYI